PSFEVNGKKVVFVDIQNVDLRVRFDAENNRTSVRAVVDFLQPEAGQPVIDLVRDVTTATLNGDKIDAAHFRTISDPDRQSSMRIVEGELPAGKHRLELEYPLTTGVRYSGGEVEFVRRASDLTPRRFAEQYFPSNFVYDRYPATVH